MADASLLTHWDGQPGTSPSWPQGFQAPVDKDGKLIYHTLPGWSKVGTNATDPVHTVSIGPARQRRSGKESDSPVMVYQVSEAFARDVIDRVATRNIADIVLKGEITSRGGSQATTYEYSVNCSSLGLGTYTDPSGPFIVSHEEAARSKDEESVYASEGAGVLVLALTRQGKKRGYAASAEGSDVRVKKLS